MKRLKISIAALFAVVLGVTFSAFNVAHTTPSVEEWFLYNGTGDLSSPSSYTYTGSISSCSSTSAMCAFKGAVNQLQFQLQRL